MASARRLVVRSAGVSGHRGPLGAVIARKVAVEIADLNPRSPLASRMVKMVEKRQTDVAKVMSGYYRGMARTVADILREPPLAAHVFVAGSGSAEGFPIARRISFRRTLTVPVASGVPRTPRTAAVVLEPGRETRKPWRGLGVNYAAGKGEWRSLPRSRRFWRKTSALNGLYAAWFATHYARVNNPDNYKVGRVTETRLLGKTSPRPAPGYVPLPREGIYVPASTRQLLKRFTFAVQPPRLGNRALDQILRRSYLAGRAQVYNPTFEAIVDITYTKGRLKGRTITQTRKFSRLSGDLQTIERIALPELRRPMLARFAAAVGRQEQAALRRLLQRK